MLFSPQNTTEITIAKFHFYHTGVYYMYYCQTYYSKNNTHSLQWPPIAIDTDVIGLSLWATIR